MRQGVQFPFQFFEGVEMEEVDQLPDNVDGLKKFKIPATIANFNNHVKDRRWFKMSKSTISSMQAV